MWMDRGIHVYVACLDMDSERMPWSNVGHLLCVATKVVKCTAVCMCRQDAIYSKKMATEVGRVLVGGKESYSSVCGKCFLHS
jgi:thymidine kinase